MSMFRVGLLWVSVIGALTLVESALAQATTPAAPSQPPAAAPEPREDAETPAQPEFAKPEGPMRVELLGAIDQRVRYVGEPPAMAASPSLRLQFKLTGARLAEIARMGAATVLEAKDELGNSLLINEDPRSDAGEKTKAFTVSGGMLRLGYVPLDVSLKSGPRNATRIASLTGFINVAYATATEELTILDPMQFKGSKLAHPRLNELGIDIEVIEPTAAETGGAGRGIGIRIRGGEDHVKSVELFDANMRQIQSRNSNRKPDDAEPYVLVSTAGVPITQDTQLVIAVYPDVEPQKIEFKLNDIALP